VAKKLLLIGSVFLVVDVLALAGWRVSHSGSIKTSKTAALSSSRSTTVRAGPSPLRESQRLATEPLTWRVVRSITARHIQNSYVTVTAKGIYLIMDVVATNTSSQGVTLSSKGINLELAGEAYPLDSDGVSGLELAGRRPLNGIQLAPATSAAGWVAFDVPRTAITSKPELCLDRQSCPAPQE
jgi:Domain of unknown function (DUF4352)